MTIINKIKCMSSEILQLKAKIKQDFKKQNYLSE